MQYKYFTVGPSQVYPKLQEFMQLAISNDWSSISHRSEKFMELFAELSGNLKNFLRIPENYSVFYSGCATEWMERAVQNCSVEKTLHFTSGVFSHRFYEFAKENGRDAKEVQIRTDFTFNTDDTPQGFMPELVCLTHNETSSGVVLPNKFLLDLKKKYSSSLFAIDIVSSVPTVDIDFSMFDCIFLSVQKGFGLPAGLGVVFVSPKALEKSKMVREAGKYTGFRHNFEQLQISYLKNQTPETPNVLNMFLLNQVVKEMSQKGLKAIIKEMEEKEKIISEALMDSSETELVVLNSDFRSKTTIVAKAKNGSKALLEKLKAKGFVVGAGYGADKDKYIRIANFPSHTIAMVQALVEEIKQL